MLYLLTLDEPVDQDDENSAAYRDNDACQVETANKISASEKAGDPAAKYCAGNARQNINPRACFRLHQP